MGKEPVYSGGKPVGYVTTAAFGFSIRKPVVYAWLPASLGEGAGVEIEYFGKRIKASVVAEPVYDADGKKLTGEGDVERIKPIRAVL